MLNQIARGLQSCILRRFRGPEGAWGSLVQGLHTSSSAHAGGGHGGRDLAMAMDEDGIRKGVLHVLQHFDHLADKDGFKDTDNLEKDLNLDSLDRLEFYKALEDEFYIELPEEAVLDLQARPLGDTVSYLRAVNVPV
ncbi:unnamed protein product [Pedinophyceae sp. YPF-701]|nr:unnamed protein product [Pedinophyceae sp. YPF-701]